MGKKYAQLHIMRLVGDKSISGNDTRRVKKYVIKSHYTWRILGFGDIEHIP